MIMDANPKVTKNHLKRDAYLYVRQSTLKQVIEHGESTRRQYALRKRAEELGWPSGRVVVIDDDLGQSGASVVNRHGFQKLAADVGVGRVGIVLGLEVSRLARNNADWHRLLELCGLTNTLILDEDGLYDPCNFNDRLLLGLKGTMSEAELHILKARMRGGVLSKAKRGELRVPLPAGFVYNERSQVVLDPDKQVQETLRLFFETYRRTGTGRSVVTHFHKERLLFPRRWNKEDKDSRLVWLPLSNERAVNILHNPRYAGAFCYGRKQGHRRGDGHIGYQYRPQAEWHALIQGAHEGYISWEEYERNQRQLRLWLQTNGRGEGRETPPREGPALLQGLALCGKCGRRMGVRYHHKSAGRSIPDYTCFSNHARFGKEICQCIPGQGIDGAISQLLLEAVTPMTLEVALNVQQELQRRSKEAEGIHRQQMERTRYETELARRRYMQVDPDNRLVADTLEAEWNERMCALEKAEQEYERRRQANAAVIDEQKQKDILALATDFPALWNNPKTSHRERKRMVRLLIEDVTLVRENGITIHVRFKGGATKTLSVPRPKRVWELTATDKELIKQVDKLLDQHTYEEAASILNSRGFRSGAGLPLRSDIVQYIQRYYGFKSRYDRLRQRGMLTVPEMAKVLKVCEESIRRWRREGRLRYQAYSKNEYLYEPPVGDNPMKKGQQPSTVVAR